MNEKYDKNNNIIYREWYDGSWCKFQYDNNNEIYAEYNSGSWWKYEYDSYNTKVYQIDSDGDWFKYVGVNVDVKAMGKVNFNLPQVSIVL